ncbi:MULTISPECIES: phosphate/phosphite/phosphonate ABC transporter substrate-binding protein [Nesterenkonia]|uniref:Phosphonate transport system substrate-binding protein n=1 Tax=Nesterenkonia xinjiangensis TaxID=225327 RepID=A0A7Z0KA24_9MICC|nr:MULTISPECIES: phosphate/phosphite/phosphonate ABC transporter substrate-binding protein [Nesterenkonia]MDZ5079143.1 phosphate/phosphite/phosphonate ABC transporter substrate-binding protein [Nesterenkonia sp. HG001]NYJ78378.1 phosphonate transport system substrate-binding protein [Nesterenkonia xinjiangensis]
MKTTSTFALGGVLTLVLAGCVADSDDDGDAGEAGGDSEEALVLGLVPSQDMDQLVEDADALAEQLSEELDREVEPYITDNYAGLVTAMQTEQADIGMFGPIALVQAIDQADAEAVLQAVRYGSDTYVTQWFTNDPDTYCLDEPVMAETGQGYEMLFCNGTDTASSGPVGEEALELIEEGETISFVDEGSASGYYYPATQLEVLNGFDPFSDIDAQFAGGHPNSVLNVYNGEISVGVSFDDARESVVEEQEDVGDEVVVFAWSEDIPNDGIALAAHLSDEEKQAITDGFLALTESEEGQEVLFDVYEIDDLVEANVDALDAAREVAANFGDDE